MTLFLKKPRPQTDFSLSLLNCVYFYFSFLWGFSVFLTCPFLELWNIFVQFVFLRTFYIQRKRQFFRTGAFLPIYILPLRFLLPVGSPCFSS